MRVDINIICGWEDTGRRRGEKRGTRQRGMVEINRISRMQCKEVKDGWMVEG